MSEREQAQMLLDAVPDYKIRYVLAYLQGVTAGEELPNDETAAAIEEIENGGVKVFSGSTHDFLSSILED